MEPQQTSAKAVMAKMMRNSHWIREKSLSLLMKTSKIGLSGLLILKKNRNKSQLKLRKRWKLKCNMLRMMTNICIIGDSIGEKEQVKNFMPG
jgi:hypothetical protein